MKIETLRLTLIKEGYNYRQQHPTKEAKRVWRYVTTKDIFLHVIGIVPLEETRIFCDAKGKEWMRITHFGILIRAGYAWNGCTPKRWYPVLGWVGTPDFKETILGSLFHDALYQFHHTQHFPLHRSDCDLIFKVIIERSGGKKIAAVYYTAVVKFGSWSGKGNGEYSEIDLIPKAIPIK